MAHATASRSRPIAVPLATADLSGLRARWDAYRTYRRTLRELNALNRRHLADIGVSQTDIERLARQTVYGPHA